jgi:hypothetical protein
MSLLKRPVAQDARGPDVRSDSGASGRLVDPAALNEALRDALRVIDSELSPDRAAADVERARRTLQRIADMVWPDVAPAAQADYEHFLRRLSQIYARVWDCRDGGAALSATAAAYAAVIASFSRSHPLADFTTPLGQLLELMTRLFAARDNDWKAVYEHLRSIPEAVAAKQTLSRVCSADIREWFDAGVHNLFSLRDDLRKKIRELDAHLEDIEDETREKTAELEALRSRLDAQGTRKVVSLAGRLIEGEIAALEAEKSEVIEETAGREDTLALVEADIQAFEGLLREARRAYFLRVV